MLTTCPKCGFSQPKDQYCARCGVDMVAYKAPEKSFLQKLSENLAVQLSIVILVGLIAVLFITRNSQESFWSRVHFLRGSSTQVARSEGGNQFSQVTQDSSHALEVSAVQNSAVSVPAAGAKPASTPQAKIYYLEIPQAVLNKWLEEGVLTRVETSEDITIGYIPQFSQALENYKAQIKILKEENFSFNLNQLYTAKLEKPTDNASTTGRAVASTEAPAAAGVPSATTLTTYATLDDDRNETLTGQLEVSTTPQTSYPAHFEMAQDQSFFISGFTKAKAADKAGASEVVVVFKVDK